MAVSTRAKLIIALVVVLGTLGLLIRTAVTKASTFYVTVNQLYQEGPSAVHEQSTVSGMIIGSTVQWNPGSSLLRFSIQDNNSGRALPVVFHGTRPDDFSNNWPVIVTGAMQSNGTFQASNLLIKCPSKYNAAKQQTYSASAQN